MENIISVSEMEQLVADGVGSQGICDAIDAINDSIADISNTGDSSGILQGLSCTLLDLSFKKYSSFCGAKFTKAAEKYPNVKVYTCTTVKGKRKVGSCDMFIENERMGEEIGELTGLRYDDSGDPLPAWRYFEDE
jgi:hypothetical protein